MQPETRVLLVPVDNTDNSQRAFEWMLKYFYKDGDELHLIHVIPRIQFAASYGVPAIEFAPPIDRDKYEAAVRKAEEFLVKRFLSVIPIDSKTTPIVHVVKVRVLWQARHKVSMSLVLGLTRVPEQPSFISAVRNGYRERGAHHLPKGF